MSKRVAATIVLELRLEPGGPAVTVQDAADWVEKLVNEGREPEGYNTARYSSTKVISVSVNPS